MCIKSQAKWLNFPNSFANLRHVCHACLYLLLGKYARKKINPLGSRYLTDQLQGRHYIVMWKFISFVYAGLSGYKWGWRRNWRQILILPLTFMPLRWGNTKKDGCPRTRRKKTQEWRTPTPLFTPPVHTPPFSEQEGVCWKSGSSDTEALVHWGPVMWAPHFPLDLKLWRPKGFKLLSTSVSYLR